MAITHLGAKSLQGTKADRVSDSLGSTANGTNSGVTLIGGALTGSATYTPELDNNSASKWVIQDSGAINLNTSNSRVDFSTKRDNSNNTLSYDLGSNLSATWTLRYKFNASTFSESENSWLTVGFRSVNSTTPVNDGSTNFDAFGCFIMNGSSLSSKKRLGMHSATASNNLTEHQDRLEGVTYSTSTDYYVEVVRTGTTTGTVTFRTGSHSGTVFKTYSYSGGNNATNLRYLTISDLADNVSGDSTLVGTITDIEIYDGQAAGDAKLGTGAYSLSGSTPVYFASANDNKLLPETGDFTIACWVKHSGHSDHQQIFRCQDSSGSSKGEFRINSSGTASQDDRLALTLNDGTNGTGGNWATVMTTNAVAQNEWVHLACTRTGATVKFYINGTLETNQNTSGTFSASSKWGNDTPRIGRMENANETLQGSIDDLAVWHRVLTATEIGDLVNAPNSWWVGGTSKNVTTDGNTVTTGSGSAWANWVHGKAVTAPTTLEFSVDDTNTNCIVGFGTGTGADSPSAGSPMKHCAYLTSGGDIFWSDSTGETDTGSNRASGDTYKLVWQSNGNLDLYLKPSGGSYGSSLKSWTSVTGTLYPMVQGYGGIVVTMLPTETVDGALVSSLSDKSGLKAYYSMNSTTTESLDGTVDISEDFSSDGWTHEDTSISGGAFNFDCDQGGVNTSHHSYKALGQTVSDSKWTMRCKLTFNNVSASGNPDGTGLWLMLCDTSNSDSGVDALGFSVILGHQSGFVPYFRLTGGDNTHPRTNLHGGSAGLSHTVTETTYYVELKRTSTTSATLSVYSDSGFSTLIESATLTISASITGLDNIQTIMFDGNNSGSQALDGTIDDIKIYDNAASVDSQWKERGIA